MFTRFRNLADPKAALITGYFCVCLYQWLVATCPGIKESH
jgi:hypothetical protein